MIRVSKTIDRIVRPICLVLLCLWIPVSAVALETVTVQLKWSHAFQFAGYYAAAQQGYYRESGLNLRIKEALPGVDPVTSVLEGEAQYGVGDSSLLLRRHEGKPLVVIAVVCFSIPRWFW